MGTAEVLPASARRPYRRAPLDSQRAHDNVHPPDTMQFAYELQKAGKPFQMMMYPKSTMASATPN